MERIFLRRGVHLSAYYRERSRCVEIRSLTPVGWCQTSMPVAEIPVSVAENPERVAEDFIRARES